MTATRALKYIGGGIKRLKAHCNAKKKKMKSVLVRSLHKVSRTMHIIKKLHMYLTSKYFCARIFFSLHISTSIWKCHSILVWPQFSSKRQTGDLLTSFFEKWKDGIFCYIVLCEEH